MNEQQLEAMRSQFATGGTAAGQSLSTLTGRTVSIAVVKVHDLDVETVCNQFYASETPMAMIPMRIMDPQDDNWGCVVFAMMEQSAKRLNQLLWENIDAGQTVLNVTDVSALKEMANIVGSCYLNSLSDHCQVAMRPSEPVFVYDMIAALMDGIMMEHSMLSDRILLVETHLDCAEEEIAMDFLFLPAPNLADLLLERLT